MNVEQRADRHAGDDAVGFDDAVLGGGLAHEVEQLIAQAGRLRANPELAEPLLLEARRRAPRHPATLIALYRYYFYGHRLAEARALAEQALALGAEPTPLQDLRTDAGARFYLFALKGYAYLSLRLGDLASARGAFERLRRLDPDDLVGAAVLSQVLARRTDAAAEHLADDGGDADPAPAVRGWSH